MRTEETGAQFALLSFTLAVFWVVCFPCNLAGQTSVIDVGNRKQLLFDDRFTASKVGFRTTMNPATRVEEPVIVADRPWEKKRFSGGQNVLQDNGTLKMWYTVQGEDGNWYLCCATSKDGLHWAKPALGIINYQGSAENNIVFAGTERTIYGAQATVFKDPHADPSRRFKLVYGSTIKSASDAASLPEVFTWDYSDAEPHKAHIFISGAYSADGLHWKPVGNLRIIDWYQDSQDVAFWDDTIGKYVLFVRWNHEKLDRSIARSESADFEHFPQPQLVLTPDPVDPVITDLYYSAAVKYPYADSAYLLFPTVFYHAPLDKGGPDGCEAQLATSRDGVSFARPWRKAFLGVGLEGRFDASQVYMGPGMLKIGDEL